jgi:hypothetical protein
LDLSNEKLVSKFAFKCNLYRYTEAMEDLSHIQVVPLMQDFLFNDYAAGAGGATA